MRRPFVEANFAMTVDGKISTRAFAPTGFTSARDKRRLLEIRARGDALLVGRRTLETDNMSMTVPSARLRDERLRRGQTAEPLRVIVSARGDLRRDLKVFRSPGAPIVVFTTASMPRATRGWLEKVADVRMAPRGRAIEVRKMLAVLGRDYGVATVVCEGGPTLLQALVEARVLDRLSLTIAPVIFGGADAPTLLGPAPRAVLTKSVPLRMENFEVIDGEAFATYRVGVGRKSSSAHRTLRLG